VLKGIDQEPTIMDTSPIRPARPIANAREQAAAGVSPQAPQSARPTTSAQPLVTTAALGSATTPPVDQDRIALIRKAIADGSYPVVPAKIADAIIAAGMLLRTPK
jgi:negative regulator of flagellin synthesis FlgM